MLDGDNVQNDPVNGADPLGLFAAKTHELITYNALLLAGASRELIDRAVEGNLYVDRLNNTLANNQHGMKDLLQHNCDAQSQSLSFRERLLEESARSANKGNLSESMFLLGQVLHDAQDEVAHDFITLAEHIVDVRNIYRDYFPLSKSIEVAHHQSIIYVNKYIRLLKRNLFQSRYILVVCA